MYKLDKYKGKTFAAVDKMIEKKYGEDSISRSSMDKERMMYLVPRNEMKRQAAEEADQMGMMARYGGAYQLGGPPQLSQDWMNQQIGHASAIQGGLANPQGIDPNWMNSQIQDAVNVQARPGISPINTAQYNTGLTPNLTNIGITNAQNSVNKSMVDYASKVRNTQGGGNGNQYSLTPGDMLGIAAPLFQSAYYMAQSKRKPYETIANPNRGKAESLIRGMGYNNRALQNARATAANAGYRNARQGRSAGNIMANVQSLFNKDVQRAGEVELQKQDMLNRLRPTQAQMLMATGADAVRQHDTNVQGRIDRERFQHAGANLLGTSIQRAGEALNTNLRNRQDYGLLSLWGQDFTLADYVDFLKGRQAIKSNTSNG